MTLDGKVTRPDGKWYGLSSRADKRRMDEIRSQSDALIVGKNSIINDNPVINIRYVENAKNPKPVILCRSGIIPSGKRIFGDKNNTPLVLCLNSNYEILRKELSDSAEIIALSDTDLLPLEVLEHLKKKGFQNILLEGGPRLNHSFFSEDLVDTLYLTIVPFVIGYSASPGIVNGENSFRDFDRAKWELLFSEQIENELFLKYERKRT